MRKFGPTAGRVFPRFSVIEQARRLGLSTILVLASALACQAQAVSHRARLGNNTEDITFITSGAFANHVAILDGYEVLGVPLDGCSPCITGHLFDLRGLGINVGPRGITFIDSEAAFALNDSTQPTTLFLTDDQGQPLPTRTIKYLGGFVPGHVEGLAYIPATSPSFPDDIIEVALTSGLTESRLEILQRDGEVVAEIIPQEPLRSDFLVGVAFKAPDRILVGTIDNAIWTLDFAGNLVAGPTLLPGVEDIEGLVQLPAPDGRVLAATYNAGTLFFFDENLNRLPDQDQYYTVGAGVSGFQGTAWNSDTDEHLVVLAGALPQATEVVSVPPTLDAATPIVDLAMSHFDNPRQTTFMPDQHLIAVAHAAGPGAILLFDTSGALVQQINISAELGNPRAITYIPTTQQFAALFSSSSQMLRILSRNGDLVSTIDLASKGIGPVSTLAFFNSDHPSGGQFLIFEAENRMTATYRAVVTDFSGDVLSQFDYRDKLGMLSVVGTAGIISGPDAGSFSAIDAGNSEIVIFTLE